MSGHPSWHADRALLSGYVEGHLDPAAAWSLEQHLTACQDCRAVVAEPGDEALVAPGRLCGIWHGIEAELDAPRPAPVEWVLTTVGVPDHVARLLSATPSLTVPWLAAVAVMLVGAAGLGHVGVAGPLLFLTIAPLVPLVGVALAFGPWSDPSHEIALAAPMPSGRLLQIRATAVTGTSFVVAALVALWLPGHGLMAAAWVLPGLAVTTTMLALSTWWSPPVAAVLVGVTWLGCVTLVESSATATLAAFGPSSQLLAAAAAVVAALGLSSRRQYLDVRGPA